MRRLILLIGIIAALGGIAGTVPAAHAAVAAPVAHTTVAVPAGPTGYASNGVVAIATVPGGGADVSLSVYSTVSNNKAQIWINGAVSCVAIFGGGSITWKGYQGNGTSMLSTGCNYQKLGTDGVKHNFWLRDYLYANGACIVDGNFNGYYAESCRVG